MDLTPALDHGFASAFEDIGRRVYQTALNHGWYDSGSPNEGERIALMHSELSEALEAIRHGNPASEHIPEFTALEEELADEVIRIMDFSTHKQLRVGQAILAKAIFNDARPYKHGGKKF